VSQQTDLSHHLEPGWDHLCEPQSYGLSWLLPTGLGRIYASPTVRPAECGQCLAQCGGLEVVGQ
jgi:hypothetical protein